MQQCTTCNHVLPFASFAPRGDTPNKRRSNCRTCVRKSNRERYHANPSTRAAHRQASYRYILKKYGLTEKDYEHRMVLQGGKCAVCGDPFEGRARVDHDHKTGWVRGLLCNACNIGLGMFRDSTERLYAAINYLSKCASLPTSKVITS